MWENFFESNREGFGCARGGHLSPFSLVSASSLRFSALFFLQIFHARHWSSTDYYFGCIFYTPYKTHSVNIKQKIFFVKVGAFFFLCTIHGFLFNTFQKAHAKNRISKDDFCPSTAFFLLAVLVRDSGTSPSFLPPPFSPSSSGDVL